MKPARASQRNIHRLRVPVLRAEHDQMWHFRVAWHSRGTIARLTWPGDRRIDPRALATSNAQGLEILEQRLTATLALMPLVHREPDEGHHRYRTM